MSRVYKVTAIEMPIYFNKEGDHDHNGLIYALNRNVPLLKYIRALANQNSSDDYRVYSKAAQTVANRLAMPLPETAAQARQPHPLVRPLVLRANVNETVEVQLQNEIKGRCVGLHLVGGGYNVDTHGHASASDGSQVGNNKPSLAHPGDHYHYKWVCKHEGVFPFHDGGNYSGGEDGTNVHGLFGALIVEPKDVIWRDPVTGRKSTEDDGEMDGLYLDVIPQGIQQENPIPVPDTLDGYDFPDPCDYADFDVKAHREFVIFFHDEPEFVPPHGDVEPDPCEAHRRDQGQQGGDGSGDVGHGSHGEILPIMPISYRAEPMVNREHLLWRWMKAGLVLDRPVLNEEQHHSSWMFGDPATPILKAYIGDPVRIRLIHGGTKETHVFHLHLYEWHAVPQDPNSPRIDAISISPQTGHTIEPVWGAGNRHQVAGDVIWHCHLYPHFHEGMWGMFRTFETLQEGKPGALLDSNDPVYRGRRIGHYPDGTPIDVPPLITWTPEKGYGVVGLGCGLPT
ncbi:multicopper oxidase domain-containing protein [Skermanella mucosa]|uniref:multicopper oxidase domain-containing protein n=1 Tax=Skermanella mucosa TaxID=1789672 RepID=UPI00192BDE41|nr:multicopper oxidase domain-containing protein [Skermanella mucosa]UEM21330.1 multicopper oxidase domain-containing protein [Skermanella mucosa]